jgi:Ca-activated chloride channel family protein
MGEPFVISKPGEAPLRAEQFRAMIQSPMLTQIKMKFQDFAVYEVEPPAVPDILADRPVMVFGKWRGRPSGRIIMTGISGQGPFTETIQVGALHPSDENSALRYLWARHRISHLSDYNRLRAKEKRAEEITELGLAYNLLTPYTSFVAIDNEVRNMDGKSTTVKQPLPLPQGVSDYAIGGSIAAQAYAPAAKASLPGEGEAFRSKEVSKDKEELKSRIINVVVSDGLSKETVLKAVNSNLQDIGKICLPEKLKGRASIIITLNAEGKVKKVSVTFGERNDKNTEKCIQDWIKKWKFPASENQQEVRIEVSLQFS